MARKNKTESVIETNLNVLDIRYYDKDVDAFVLKDGSYLDFLEVVSKDRDNTDDDERQHDNYDMMRFYKLNRNDTSWVSLNFPFNAAAQKDGKTKRYQRTNDPARKMWLNRHISEFMTVESAITRREFFQKVYGDTKETFLKNRKNALDVLGHGRNRLIKPISGMKKIQIQFKLNNMNSQIVSEENINKTEYALVSYDGQHEIADKSRNDEKPSKRKRRKKTKTEETQYVDMPLFEYIQPQGGITFSEPNYILSGDGYIKVIHIYQLPKDLNEHWMDKIFNIDGTIATADVFTKDVTEVKKNINKSLQEQYSRERNATDFAEVYDARKRQQELQRMYDELSSMGEVIKMLHFRIFVPGRNLFTLEERVDAIVKKLESDNFMATVLLNEGKREWQSLFRSYTKQHKEPFYMKGLPLTSEQLAIGNPFHYSELLDEQGTLLGFTPCGGVVSFDLWEKSAHRNYYNALACGDLGAGKSTFLKKLFVANAADGNYVRVFDASGEFTSLVKEFGGKIIKCNGVDGMLNPLEILKAGDDEFTSYARHITKFGTFFKCIKPDAEDSSVIALQNELRNFYDSLGLVPQSGKPITGLPATSYPTLGDFWQFCKDEIAKIVAKNVATELELEQLKLRLYSLNTIEEVLNNLVTNYGNMFNGHTSIDNITDERIVSFDISDIRNLRNVFAAQMYNMTTLNWDNAIQVGSVMKEKYEGGELAADEVTKFLILIDESHEWINTKMPVILDIMGKYLREARKYFAGLVFASQSVRDFNPEGQDSQHMDLLKTFFELTQYKFMFRQSSAALPLLNNIFNNELSFAQIKQIPMLGQGETILSIAGDMSIRFNVWLSKEYEAPLFAGGR